MCDISEDERVRGSAATGEEGVVMWNIHHLTHPVRVQVRNVLHADKAGVIAERLQEEMSKT